MPISIPDTLTTDNSGKYIVSIRLRSDGLSFSGHIPSVGESFFYRETEFDRSVSYISSLKELFFSYEFLTWSYKKVHVIDVSPDYTLVPKALFDEREKDKLLHFNLSQTGVRSLSNSLQTAEAELVFGMQEEVYEFCSRTLVRSDFIHHLTPQLWLWKKQSELLPERQMFVVLHSRMMDIVCYDRGKLLFANTFSSDQADDAVYYLLYVWQQVGLDQRKDALYIFGNSLRKNKITGMVRTYVHHVRTMPIPSEAYLMGTGVFQAPMDLISLLLCEL